MASLKFDDSYIIRTLSIVHTCTYNMYMYMHMHSIIMQSTDSNLMRCLNGDAFDTGTSNGTISQRHALHTHE